MKHLLVKDLLWQLNSGSRITAQKRPEYLEWAGPNVAYMANEFVQEDKLTELHFIKSMNITFRTTRFELLLKRWVVEYLLRLFEMLDDFVICQLDKELALEDIPLNRFAVEKYYSRFGILPKIKWSRPPGLARRFLSILLRPLNILYLSLDKGVKISGKRKKYKVMREAIWGLYNTGGYYFHDDFLVDGNKIKKEDLLLFSRGIPVEEGRLKGYHDAKKSPYRHFNLLSLPLGINPLFSRIIPKYIISSSRTLFKEMCSVNFSLYWSIYLYFIYNALSYEKVFSHFEIVSELGHNYFSASHIAEAIVCQNHGVRYYLMHWSDNSISINKYLLSFLGCDGFLVWGDAHVKNVKTDPKIFIPTGYVFKRFIKEAMANRDKILKEMGIKPHGKIISFFDESFGGECMMTEENYVTFWETALKLAMVEKNNTVVMKPKELERYNNLSIDLKEKFLDIKDKMEKMLNVHIMILGKWCFIEIIGISDIVVTQGMTSSATIAIICEIQGLYLDEAQYKHPFSRLFKDRLVFDNPEKLVSMIRKAIKGLENPLKDIPENLLKEFDAYPDDRGIDLFRDILSGRIKKRVGIIIQARMRSTRLPGKIMKLISGKPILEILIERLKKCKSSDILVIATSCNRNDDAVKKLAEQLDIACFRGDEDDVLGRYYEAAKRYCLDVIVRITSDCPLMDPLLVDNLIKYYFDNLPVDYVTNIIKRTYPRGFDIEVFSFESLKKAAEEATMPYQREHVTPFIYENMNILNYESKKNFSKYRVTVDTIEDFELITEIYKSLNENRDFGYKQVINLLNSRPDLVAINQHVEQKKI